MQRQGDAARANLHALSDHCEGGAEHGRIRVKAAEIFEVAFGRPDRTEAVAVGKLRALQNETIFVGRIFRTIVREEVETEAQTLRAGFILPVEIRFALLCWLRGTLKAHGRRSLLFRLLERQTQALLLQPQLQQRELLRCE